MAQYRRAARCLALWCQNKRVNTQRKVGLTLYNSKYLIPACNNMLLCSKTRIISARALRVKAPHPPHVCDPRPCLCSWHYCGVSRGAGAQTPPLGRKRCLWSSPAFSSGARRVALHPRNHDDVCYNEHRAQNGLRSSQITQYPSTAPSLAAVTKCGVLRQVPRLLHACVRDASVPHRLPGVQY